MKIALLLFIILFVAPLALHAQVTLQPWVEGFGSTNGEQLGKYVTGITPSTNLPYRAAISKVGSTGIYRLNTPSDTSVQKVFFGENLLTGDLNGDGWTDAVVRRTTNQYDTLLLYWGTITGLDTLQPTRLSGEFASDRFGEAMCIKNLVGDAIPDLIVTAPGYPSGTIRGKVYLFQGGNPFSPTPVVTLLGDSARYTLGRSCAIGDLNDDSYPDLAVRGDFQLGFDPERWHYADIWFGGAVFDTVRDFRLRNQYQIIGGLAVFDANGDSKDDLLWTTVDASDSGRVKVFIHYGRTMFDTIPDMKLRNPSAVQFGYALTNGRDMNGDGYNEVVVGCPASGAVFGVVIVYAGGPLIDPFVDAAVSRGSDAAFGRTVASLGDVTGDGLADIIVGGPTDPFGENRGRWGIFKGDTNILVTAIQETSPLPDGFLLGDAYPNPFNPLTTIPYEAHVAAVVTLRITDVLGRVVTTLVHGEHQPGTYKTGFDGSVYASGVYYYQMHAVTNQGIRFTQTKKLLLIR